MIIVFGLATAASEGLREDEALLNQKTPQIINASNRATPATDTTTAMRSASLVSSEPSPREEVTSVGETVGAQVETSRTMVLEVSTTGTPKTTVVEEVIIVEPSAMHSSTHRVAVAGSEKETAT